MQAAIEAKVREQLKEKTELLGQLKTDTQDQIRSLEKENREMSSKLHISEREKKSQVDMAEKRVSDIAEKERKY